MKKHFLNKVSSVLIVMICVLSAVLSVPHPVKALQDTGNINIQIAPFAEGEELSLYDIGRYISGFQLDPFFKESGVDLSKAKNASELMECANKLLNYIKDFEGPQPVAKARVDSTGTAKFMHINADYKLYMIVQSSDTNKIAISPMIVEMPYYTKISGEYLYNMKIQAKYFDTRGKEKLSAIVLDKICPKGNPLRNAMFTFEQKMYYSNEKMIPDEAETGEDKNGTFYWKRLSKSMATNDNGQIVVEDLPFGVYRFKEYRAPTGFLLDTTPIIAHVERYDYVSKDPTILYDLVERGCLAHVNAEVLIRDSSKSSLPFKYIKWGLVHFICSDCHSIEKRPPNIEQGYSIIRKKLGEDYFDMLTGNAERVFNGKRIDLSEIKKPRNFFGSWI